MSTPVAVTRDPTLGVHFKGERLWARPGFSLTVPLDDPVRRQRKVVVQLDVPAIFR